jgi:hypothetical protein
MTTTPHPARDDAARALATIASQATQARAINALIDLIEVARFPLGMPNETLIMEAVKNNIKISLRQRAMISRALLRNRQA